MQLNKNYQINFFHLTTQNILQKSSNIFFIPENSGNVPATNQTSRCPPVSVKCHANKKRRTCVLSRLFYCSFYKSINEEFSQKCVSLYCSSIQTFFTPLVNIPFLHHVEELILGNLGGLLCKITFVVTTI